MNGKTQRTSLPSASINDMTHRARQAAPLCAVPTFLPVFPVAFGVEISELKIAHTFLNHQTRTLPARTRLGANPNRRGLGSRNLARPLSVSSFSMAIVAMPRPPMACE